MWGELTMCTIVHTLMEKSGNRLQVEPTVWILKSMISDGTVARKIVNTDKTSEKLPGLGQ